MTKTTKLIYPSFKKILYLPLEELVKSNKITEEPKVLVTRDEPVTAVSSLFVCQKEEDDYSLLCDASGDKGTVRNTSTGEVMCEIGKRVEAILGLDHNVDIHVETKVLAAYLDTNISEQVSHFHEGKEFTEERKRHDLVFYDILRKEEFTRVSILKERKRLDDGTYVCGNTRNIFFSLGGRIYVMDTQNFIQNKEKTPFEMVALSHMEGLMNFTADYGHLMYFRDHETDGHKLMMRLSQMESYPLLHFGVDNAVYEPVMSQYVEVGNRHLLIYGGKAAQTKEQIGTHITSGHLFAVDLMKPKAYKILEKAFDITLFFGRAQMTVDSYSDIFENLPKK